ncbi:WD40 repeat domain-containing protein [Anabaena sp. UHCC 0399]|uniref:WD40 repeat domain-containing protein n=1 Tax=Anabaena sp. UHCC 0399 TaxID=3110238 RepID=UPI002B1FFE52|nr:WD40 repeat domain-containing protein [Anabaena sp. UHCC 0399]MEA5566188.1 WD40 repeat domain-containing protein [Anabaena sp. UHCC 0399]
MSKPSPTAKFHLNKSPVLGRLGSLIRIIAALITLILLGIWGLDLWYRMTSSSKPLSEHLHNQWADIHHLIWISQKGGAVVVDSDGTIKDLDGNLIPAKEVDNACLNRASASAPPPEAWRSLGAGTLLKQPSGSGVTSLVITPNGNTLISAGKQVVIWDLTTRTRIRTLSGQTEFVYAMALSPDGQTIATGDKNGTIALWNFNTGQLQRTLSHGDTVYQLTFGFDGNILFSGGIDKTIKRWNLKTGSTNSLSTRFSVQHMAITPNQRMVAVGSDQANAVQILFIATGDMVGMPIHGKSVSAIAFNSTGRILASASGLRGGIRLWDMQDRPYIYQPIKTLQGHQGQPFAITFSPDDRTLFATADGFSGRNYAVTVWNACTGELVHRFGDQVRGLSIAISNDGKTLVTGGRKGDIQMWRLP